MTQRRACSVLTGSILTTCGLFAGALLPISAAHAQPAVLDAPAAPSSTLEAFWQEIPEAAFKFELVPIPASADGTVGPFWMSTTELRWEAFDVYVYQLDDAGVTTAGPDAITRPSKPYLPPDRGFGHEGFAAISPSYRNASEFCRWLSAKTGRHYRLPTAAEWEHAARAGATTEFPFGDDPAALPGHAWFAENADGTPHAVGKLAPNAWGLYDMLGNVAEWCTGPDGKPVVKGGSYRDAAEALKPALIVPQSSAWNASDPQIPKSKWWLSDGPFIGFRIICDPQPAAAGPALPGGASK